MWISHHDRNSGAFFHAGRNKKKNDRGLKYIHSHNLFGQIVFGDHGIKPYHHQDDINPVIIFGNYKFHYFNASSCSPLDARSRKMENKPAATVISTPISTPKIPRDLASSGPTGKILERTL